MPTLATTSRFAVRYPTSANNGTDFATGVADLAADVDTLLTPFSTGVVASRPAAGKVGRRYLATDVGPNGTEYVDIGAAWVPLQPSDGAAGTPSLRTLGTGATQAAAGNDSRLSNSRAPTGAAAGVLSGTYPNPGFAVDMATQAELDAAITAAIQTGFMLDWPVTTPPSGWLLCDGSSQLRATYPALSTLLLATYGSADGTHFYLPDHRGRVAVMVDGAAGRLSANDAIAQSGGEEKHTLTTAELAAHTHDFNSTTNVLGDDSGDATVTYEFTYPNGTPGGHLIHRMAAGTKAAGSGSPHNVMQPYAVVNRIIKT